MKARVIYLVIRENPLVENPLLSRPHWASGVQTSLQNLQQSLHLINRFNILNMYFQSI